jgi:acetolactate synthase I/II/III large subunit
MKCKVSDLVARFLEQKGVRHGFGIIGSANSHIFDSVCFQSDIELVCQHHEQACTMAVQSYWKLTGKPSFALVTAGAGSSNAITGVLSAWADSIPCLILSGQENGRYIQPDAGRRMWGIQGYDSTGTVACMTKYAARVMRPENVLFELEKAWYLATTGRPGPCWLDFPMDVQAAEVEESSLPHFHPNGGIASAEGGPLTDKALSRTVATVYQRLREAKAPLLWLGVGVRMAGASAGLLQVVESLGIPVVLAWSAVDLLASEHPLVVGRPGVYGQRAANLILQSCDYLLTVGTRLAIPQVGYDIAELCRGASDISCVDIDPAELRKYPTRVTQPICADAGNFLSELDKQRAVAPLPRKNEWVDWCTRVRTRFPTIGPEHADNGGFINSYRFMERLTHHLKPDQVIVTDMGTALLSGHQALSLRPPQRLITSQGLGEMGFGLPGAIGASFARDRGEVLCLNCDGGMMMNLQELQTIAHHRLPIKIVVFNNDGYLMIKHTQKAVLKGRYAGTDKASGVSCPDFGKVAAAFDMPSFQVRTWEDFERHFPAFQQCTGPAVCEVFMSPEQFFHPKLGLVVGVDGRLVSPPLEDLSPLLSREELAANLRVPLHPKSAGLAGA